MPLIVPLQYSFAIVSFSCINSFVITCLHGCFNFILIKYFTPYCYNINPIQPHQFISIKWMGLNGCVTLAMPWLQSFTASFLRVNEESELISSHFVHFFNSSLNFIQFHSMNWLKWEWMKPFTAPAVWTRFTRGRCAAHVFHSLIHSISLTSFQFS